MQVKDILISILFLSLHFTATAAAPYPDKPVRIVVPFPAGAAADNAMRVVAKKLSELWGQSVRIDNKPGAPGFISVSMAPADGHTLVMGAGSNIVTGPLINSKLPYSPAKDFVPVGRVLINVPVLVVNPSLGVKTLQDLIALAKSKPGVLNYSSSGIGSPNHLAMEMLQASTNTNFVHIPYKGGAPSVNELVGGHVQLGINAIPSVISQINAGKLLPIAVASAKRDRNLPKVPTIAESGVSGFEYEIWYAIFAPAKTAPTIVSKISADLQRALADPDVISRLVEQGAEPKPSSSEELAQYILRDIDLWKLIIKDRNIKAE